jgi:hypothetical protein
MMVQLQCIDAAFLQSEQRESRENFSIQTEERSKRTMIGGACPLLHAVMPTGGACPLLLFVACMVMATAVWVRLDVGWTR